MLHFSAYESMQLTCQLLKFLEFLNSLDQVRGSLNETEVSGPLRSFEMSSFLRLVLVLLAPSIRFSITRIIEKSAPLLVTSAEFQEMGSCFV